MIKDFGEKIGGARKDLWKERGLMVEDLEEMTSNEKDKYVKKDCVWPKADMKALVVAGEPRFVVYFKNEVRKWVHPKPYQGYASAEAYVEGVRKIKELTDSLKREEDIPTFIKDLTSLVLYETRRHRYDYQGNYRGIIKGQSILNYESSLKLKRLKEKMYKDRFEMTEEEIMNYEYPLLYVDGTALSVEEEYGKTYVVKNITNGKIFFHPANNIVPKEHDWIVLIRNNIVFSNEDKELCIQEQKRLFASSENKGTEKSKSRKKTAWIPPQFAVLNRTGDDFRHDRHIIGKDFMEAFHVRGGEFGNWLNDKECQTSLDMAYDAFYDMAQAIGIQASDISLPHLSSKGLAIAFGARGRGNALAHYEPTYEVINLTKLRGAGSLAHEWGHALDHMIGKLYTSTSVLATETFSDDIPKSFRDIMRAIKYAGKNSLSKYYTDSVKYGSYTSKSGHGYWSSDCELFARAFACYVKDRLSGENDYLCGHAEANYGKDDDGNNIYAFPRGEERKYINEKFDLFFKDMINKDVFKPYKAPKTKVSVSTIKTPTIEGMAIEIPSYNESANGQLSFF